MMRRSCQGKVYGLTLAAAMVIATAAFAGEWLNPDGSRMGGSGQTQPRADAENEISENLAEDKGGGKAMPESQAEPTPVPPVTAEPNADYLANVPIPPGHLPPPGACRLWFIDRPPGHQPPPGPCAQLRHQVSAGVFLVKG